MLQSMFEKFQAHQRARLVQIQDQLIDQETIDCIKNRDQDQDENKLDNKMDQEKKEEPATGDINNNNKKNINKQLRWSTLIPNDILMTLSDEEKHRQQIIFELYHTERNHVRNLNVLETVFKPVLLESGLLQKNLMDALFPQSLLTLHDLHFRFEVFLKDRCNATNFMVGEIGDILTKMFCGHSGKELKSEVSAICRRQQTALLKLEEMRRKDEKLNVILNQAESEESCHLLKLEHIIPTVWQRFTKYPLLFKNLHKVSSIVLSNNQREIDSIYKAWTASREILEHVNYSIKRAEDQEKLWNIQSKLIITKDVPPKYRKLDLTKENLVYDGDLKVAKTPDLEFRGLLFDNKLILLQKKSDKFILSRHQISEFVKLATDKENFLSPIIEKFIHVNPNASDKNSFFLITESGDKTLELLEIATSSHSECNHWCKLIKSSKIYSNIL